MLFRSGGHRNAEWDGFVRENGSATRQLFQDESDNAAAEMEGLRRKNENLVGTLSGLLSSGFSLAQVRDKTLMESIRRNSCMHVCNKSEGGMVTVLGMFDLCCIQVDTTTSVQRLTACLFEICKVHVLLLYHRRKPGFWVPVRYFI